MDSDRNRFRKIVKGRIKKDLRKFISNGDLMGRQGNKNVTIPLLESTFLSFSLAQMKAKAEVVLAKVMVKSEIKLSNKEKVKANLDRVKQVSNLVGTPWKLMSAWKNLLKYSEKN